MRTIRSLVAAAAMAAVATPALAEQELIWWDFLGGGDGVRMKALIERFNEEHADNISITATTLEWGVPFYTKVRTSAAVGEGPDIMTYHQSRIPLALEEGVLSPITDADLGSAGLSKGDFFELSIEAASAADGTLYAVPFDIHSVVLYYNKDALGDAGLLDGDGNLTGIGSLADFEAALVSLVEGGMAEPLSYATADAGTTYRVFYTLFSQMGGELISGDEILAGDNAEKAQRAIEIMAGWRDNGWAPQQAEYPASVALFTSGRSAFHWNGVWEVPTMVDLAASGELGFEWGAIQIPALMGEYATWADSHAFAIPQQPDPMDPDKRAAVMTVIGWMAQNSLAWAEAGHIPALRAVSESDAFKSMEPNATYAALAETVAYDPRSEIAGVASPLYDAVQNLIVPAVDGFLSPKDAVAQMQGDLQRLMR